MIIIKDMSVLKKYGWDEPTEYDEHWTFDCGDNRTYLWVDESNGNAVISYTPEYYGDSATKAFLNQFDIIYKMLLDGVAELKYVEPNSEEYPSGNSKYRI